MTIADPNAPDPGFKVKSPSGADFYVLNASEKAYWEDRVKRYMTDNHFVNVTDLQDVDRLMVMELLMWRWGLWLSQENDYWGNSVDPDALQKAINEYSKELRQVKKLLGIDKVTRDKEKGESVAEYIENLRRRAKQFGIVRNEQSVKSITLFKELHALVTLHDNCTESERKNQDIELEDIMDWLREVAFPEFDEIDKNFKETNQTYWIHEM